MKAYVNTSSKHSGNVLVVPQGNHLPSTVRKRLFCRLQASVTVDDSFIGRIPLFKFESLEYLSVF